MSNDFQGNRKKRQGVSVPDFKRETEREYQYAKRPNRPGARGEESEQEYQKRKKREEELGKRNVIRNQNKEKTAMQAKSSSNPKSGKKKKTAKKKKSKKILKSMLMVSMFCVAVLLGHILGRVHAQVNQVLNQRKESEIRLNEVVVDESQLDSDDQIINILLVGSDKRESWSESGRSDATMIATIDKKHKRLKLTSLMRDMYVEIPNHGKNKFNAS